MVFMEDIFSGVIPAFLLVLTRIGAFFATAPVFSWQVIPNPIKLSITLGITLFYAVFLVPPISFENTGPIPMAILIGQELIYGACLGLVTQFLFSVIRQVGHFVERQMGLQMANIMDPFSDEPGQPIGTLLEILFILMLLNTNGHYLLLQILGRSFDQYQPGTIPSLGALTESIVIGSSTMFLIVLRMAAPLLTAFLLLLVVLGLMARVAPEANILFLSLPLRVGMGLAIVGLFVPYIYEYLQRFSEWTIEILPF